MNKSNTALLSVIKIIASLCLSGAIFPSAAQVEDLPLKNAGSGGFLFGGGLGLGGQSGLNGVGAGGGIPTLRSIDSPFPTASQLPRQEALAPLKPNDFQRFVLETAGYKLPLYGQEFFDNLPFNPINNAPVSGDYPLGPGDQVLVRGWGSLDIDARLVVDRNGMVSIPRVGSVALAGVKANQAEGVIRNAVSKYYKGFELSVTLGQLRSITVYVVGQARRPGSYSISSVSTLASGLFATGGPNATGSMRRIQLKRSGKVIAELDLYKFLATGSDAAEVKLIDGDVIVIPPAVGYIALVGKVNNPAVYEIKSSGETLDGIIEVAGGLPVVADARRVTLERLDASQSQPRTVLDFALNSEGLKTLLKNGDMLTVASIAPELNNAVTLRGNVSSPRRVMWREGLRIRDLIPNKEALISRDSIRRQNETLFDSLQRERTRRDREAKPDDLTSETDTDRRASGNPSVAIFEAKSAPLLVRNQSIVKNSVVVNEAVAIESISDYVGNLYDEINWDYALIERLNRKDLTVSLVPFSLNRAFADEKSKDNQLLQAGDIVTIFSVNDLSLPQSKRRLFVRVDGEVSEPGIYEVKNGATLKDLLRIAGGLTQDAYLFGAGLYREEIKKTQAENIKKLLARMESEASNEIVKISASSGASADSSALQIRVQAAQQAQRRALLQLRSIKPEGRVALGIPAELKISPGALPDIKLRNGDRFSIPPRPDYVYVYGAINSESALIFKPVLSVSDYLKLSGITESGDRDAAVLLRANGEALAKNNGSWFSSALSVTVMPGDSIIVPQKYDLEPFWSTFTRNTKDITQIFYQLGLGAAAIKTLRN